MTPIAASPSPILSSRCRQAVLAVMALLATLLAGCGPGQDATPEATHAMPVSLPGNSQADWLETGDLSAISERGVLRILVHQGQESHLPRRDYPIGASRKWLRQFAEEQGLAVRFVTVAAYADLIPALLQGRGDIIASNMTVLHEREQLVQFTLPLDNAREHLVARITDPLTADSDLSGRTIAVQRGTSFADTALALQKQYSDLNIDYVSTQLGDEEMLDKLVTGEFDLTIADGNYLTAAGHYRKDFRRVLPVSIGRDIAWAVRPTAINLLGEINHFITEEKLAAAGEFLSHVDFDAIQKRKILRVAMHNTMASYYLWRGELYGFEYELARHFAEQHQLRLQIVVAEDYTRILDLLREGKADIAAAFITPTPWRESINIAFSRPNHYASEILVSRPDSGIEDFDELGNREISVRKSSAYWQSLQRLVSKGKILNLRAASEQLDTEQLIDQVASGAIDLTVADSHILDLELTWRDDVIGSLSLGDPRPQAWAVRESNPLLLHAINQFFTREYRGEFYESVYQKYFKIPRHNARRTASLAMPATEAKGLSPYDELIKRYADQYQFDWLVIAAQIYQESRFDASARSWSGAQGLMQILPQTARALGLVDIEDTETGLHAGVKYMAWLRNSLGNDLADEEQLWFSLAAYNAGIGHLRDARSLARRLGKNPDLWFDHVEQAMLLLSTKKYAKKARHGYVRGIEPVQYVSTIRSRYQSYRELDLNTKQVNQVEQ